MKTFPFFILRKTWKLKSLTIKHKITRSRAASNTAWSSSSLKESMPRVIGIFKIHLAYTTNIIRTVVFQFHSFMGSTRDKRVTEIDYQLKYAIFSTACSIVYKYCTRPISKHLYSGIFKDPLDTKHKIFKKDWIHECYVSCLKLEYFFKSCKT